MKYTEKQLELAEVLAQMRTGDFVDVCGMMVLKETSVIYEIEGKRYVFIEAFDVLVGRVPR